MVEGLIKSLGRVRNLRRLVMRIKGSGKIAHLVRKYLWPRNLKDMRRIGQNEGEAIMRLENLDYSTD